MNLTKSILLVSVFSIILCTPTIAQHDIFIDGNYFPAIAVDQILHRSDGKHNMQCMNFASVVMNRPEQSQIIRRPYDVLSYNIFMDWRNPLTSGLSSSMERMYTGKNTISLRIDSAQQSSIAFNAGQLSIDSVISAGQHLTATQPKDGEFRITLSEIPNIGEILTFDVFYRYIGNTNRGFHAYTKNTYAGLGPQPKRDSVFTAEQICYTMSQPEEARNWVPCNDQPYDKARASIVVRVPYDSNEQRNITVTSNGRRTIGEPKFDEIRQEYYRDFFHTDTTLISTYLMVANASKFSESTQYFRRTANPNDSVPIFNAVWAVDSVSEDTDGQTYNAAHAFRLVPGMMEWFSRLFGEYPFASYGHTAVQPFPYGGMEHQTMTTVNRGWLRGSSDAGIAHEIAHQWIGDLTTCATWKDIWLNEGGATWGEALWFESWGGNEWYMRSMNGKRNAYLANQPQPSIYGIDISAIFNYPTTYAKSSWVYHMLRKMLNDSVFYATLNGYLSKYRFGVVETEDMYRYFTENVANPPMDFRIFFDQWLYSAGHPIYEVAFLGKEIGNGKYETEIEIKQIQTGENVPNEFVMPMQLRMRSKGKTDSTTFSFLNDKRVQKVTMLTGFPIADVIIDPNENILCEKTNLLTSALENETDRNNNDAMVFPNPSSNTAILQFSTKKLESTSIKIFDVFGNELHKIFENNLSRGEYAFSIPSSQFAVGNYVIQLIRGGYAVYIPMTVAH